MWHLCFSNNTLSDGHNQPRFTLLNVFTFKLIQSVLLWKSFFGDYTLASLKQLFQISVSLDLTHFALSARRHALSRGGGPVFRGRADPPRPRLQPDLHREAAPGHHRHLRNPRGRVVSHFLFKYCTHTTTLYNKQASKFNIQRICLLGVLYSEMDFIIN